MTDAVLAGWTLAFGVLTAVLVLGGVVVWRRCPAGVQAPAPAPAEALALRG